MAMRVSIIAQTDEEIMNFVKESSRFHHNLDNDYVRFYTRLPSNRLIHVKKNYNCEPIFIPRDTTLVILLVPLGPLFEESVCEAINNVYIAMGLPPANCSEGSKNLTNKVKRPDVALYATQLSEHIQNKQQDQIQKNYKELTALGTRYKLKKTGIIDLNNCYDVVKELFN